MLRVAVFECAGRGQPPLVGPPAWDDQHTDLGPYPLRRHAPPSGHDLLHKAARHEGHMCCLPARARQQLFPRHHFKGPWPSGVIGILCLLGCAVLLETSNRPARGKTSSRTRVAPPPSFPFTSRRRPPRRSLIPAVMLHGFWLSWLEAAANMCAVSACLSSGPHSMPQNCNISPVVVASSALFLAVTRVDAQGRQGTPHESAK